MSFDVETLNAEITYYCKNFELNPNLSSCLLLTESYLKSAEIFAVEKSWFEFYDCISCVELLHINNQQFYDIVVNYVLKICFRCINIIENSQILDCLFNLVSNISFKNKTSKYKEIFVAFHWYSRFWDGYLDFCDWWQFSNFSDDDFVIKDKRDSLAESAYIAYSRRLINCSLASFMFDFYADFISKMLKYNFTVYSDYHISRFLIRIGIVPNLVLTAYRRYIKQKFSKPWSWITLSQIFDEQSIEYNSCILFAQFNQGLIIENNDLDFKKYCRNLFIGVKDPDESFWLMIRERLLSMKINWH